MMMMMIMRMVIVIQGNKKKSTTLNRHKPVPVPFLFDLAPFNPFCFCLRSGRMTGIHFTGKSFMSVILPRLSLEESCCCGGCTLHLRDKDALMNLTWISLITGHRPTPCLCPLPSHRHAHQAHTPAQRCLWCYKNTDQQQRFGRKIIVSIIVNKTKNASNQCRQTSPKPVALFIANTVLLQHLFSVRIRPVHDTGVHRCDVTLSVFCCRSLPWWGNCGVRRHSGRYGRPGWGKMVHCSGRGLSTCRKPRAHTLKGCTSARLRARNGFLYTLTIGGQTNSCSETKPPAEPIRHYYTGDATLLLLHLPDYQP